MLLDFRGKLSLPLGRKIGVIRVVQASLMISYFFFLQTLNNSMKCYFADVGNFNNILFLSRLDKLNLKLVCKII